MKLRIWISLVAASAGLAACGGSPDLIHRDMSPDGFWWAIAHAREVQVRQAQTWDVWMSFSGGHEAAVSAVRFSSDGTRLISGDLSGKLVVWDSREGKKVGSLAGHADAIESLAVRSAVPDLASASDDGTIKLWNVAAEKEVRTLAGHEKAVYFVGFTPDGKRLISASKDKTLKLWDVDAGTVLATLTGLAKPVRTARFDLTGTMLAAGGADGILRLWDAGTLQEKRTFQRAAGMILSVEFSADGRWLLAHHSLKNPFTKQKEVPLGVWNVETGELAVHDYDRESRLAPPDWPYKAIVEEVARRTKQLLK
jgi:WD40 repeat protein